MGVVCPQLRASPADDSVKSKVAVQKFAAWLTQCEITTGAFWLSSAYTRLLDPEYRKANAMYFTPPSLTTRLLDDIESHGDTLVSGRIVDPACGGAAFLGPAAQRIARILSSRGFSPTAVLEHIEANLYGCDTSEFLCFLTGTFLRMVLADVIAAAGRAPQFKITLGDGLTLFPRLKGKFSLVLCNPPYRKLTQTELAPYAKAYKEVLNGQPNLYSLFIHRATELLAPTGIAGLLTPMSFLSGQSFVGVRSVLLAKGAVRQLDLIHEKLGVFLLAEQDTVITVWEKGADFRNPAEAFCLNGSGTETAGSMTFSARPGPWPIPRANADAELLPLFSQPPSNLKDYGYVTRTGAIVIHRDSRERFRDESEGAAAKKLVPLIWSSNIDPNGGLRLDRLAPKCSARFVDAISLDSTCLVKKPAVAFQRVSTNDQPRRIICVAVPDDLIKRFGGVTGENHVGFFEQTDPKSRVSPEMLVKILSTETLDRLFRCISGATNVSAYELLHLPLPRFELVARALELGFSIDEAVRIGLGLLVAGLDAAQLLTKVPGIQTCAKASGVRKPRPYVTVQ